ncbi:CS1-pili formation C-terminal [Pseudomonas sp. NFACC32-1]|uniref:TcfC E-set like domain-containing protein n=1 Tax=Pseudomonas sp. NFACC32-1 TaxID=1566198 RepID=UPI00087621EF|nr:TcfC E-set like domain-containing protein [Pseudomonas sp. NFACC32-1]SCX62152.1 CS1-pili formation C-terminal [Pseudomonas sp. NFACC32-1]
MKLHFTALSISLSWALADAVAATSDDLTRVPAGFEALVEGQVEQLELQLFNRNLGLHPVLVRPGRIEFQQPERIAALLVEAGALATPQELLPLLSQPLPSNSQLACSYGLASEASCGYLETEAVAVILDEAGARLQMLLRKDWLPTNEASTLRLHTPSEAQNALVHRQNINIAQSDSYRALGASGLGALGLGENSHLGFTWIYQANQNKRGSDSNLEFNNAYYRRDFDREHYAQAGRMDMSNLSSAEGGNFNFSLLPLGRIDGARVGTTLAYLNRDVVGQGTPISLILTQRARVDAFRGEELLSTSYLDAGVQNVDTRTFPNGSYPVTLRVIENGQVTRTETVPFSRTDGNGLGDDTVQWFLQGGRTAEHSLYEQDPAAVVQTGLRVPLLDNLALTSGITWLDTAFYNESRLDWAGTLGASSWSLSAAILEGNDGASGNSQQLTFNHGLSWNLYRYSLRSPSCEHNRRTYQQSGCNESLTASASLPLAGGALSAGYSYNRYAQVNPSYYWNTLPGEPDLTDELTTATWARTLQVGFSRGHPLGQFHLTHRVGAFRNQSGNRPTDHGVYLSLSLSHNERSTSGGFRHSSVGMDARRERAASDSVRTSLAHTRVWDGEQGRNELNTGLGYDDLGRWDAELAGRLERSWGETSLAVSQRGGDRNDSRPGLSGNHSSSLALGREGFFWGHGQGGTGPGAAVGIVAAPADNANGAAAKVSGGYGSQTSIGFGEKRLIPINGFQVSQTRISDADASRQNLSTVNVGNGSRDWFLPPGKLAVQYIESSLSYTYVGRLVDAQGQPLAQAAILNAAMMETAEDGSFVVDLAKHPQPLFALDLNGVHACAVQSATARSSLRQVGTLTCHSTTLDALPKDLNDPDRLGRWTARRSAALSPDKRNLP